MAWPSNAAYIAAKGGVATVTKSIAVDFAPFNIRANAICPGTVPTPLATNHYINRGEVSRNDIEGSIATTRRRKLGGWLCQLRLERRLCLRPDDRDPARPMGLAKGLEGAHI